MDTEFCTVCGLHWGAHFGPEFVAHLLQAIDRAIEAKFKELKESKK